MPQVNCKYYTSDLQKDLIYITFVLSYCGQNKELTVIGL